MRRSTLFWGSILIVIGLLVLLDNMNIININIWSLIWPLFLILLGVWILFGHLLGGKTYEVEHAQIPLDGSTDARIRVNHAAGRLHINGGTAPGYLVEGDFSGGVDVDTRRRGDQLEVSMKLPSMTFPDIPWFWGGGNLDWSFNISSETPISLNISMGAGESRIDLSSLKVSDVKLQTGASSTALILPEQAGFTSLRVEAGVASVLINIPSGVAARIRNQSGLTSLNVDKARFLRQGNVYQSGDYDTAQNKVDMDIRAGVGSIEIR